MEWTSSNTNVATVDTTGKVTGVSAGSATITVKTKDGSKVATCNVTVKNPVISVTGVTLNKTALNLVTGASESLVATISPSNATNKDVEWTSSNTNVATVDTTGKVTGVSSGSATITVKTKDGTKVATCNVTVKNPIAINDINKHWAESTITDFISNGYINGYQDNTFIYPLLINVLSWYPFIYPLLINGYQDNTFRPNNSITRAEFIKIFNKYFGLNKKSGKTFKDTSTHWAKDEIDIADIFRQQLGQCQRNDDLCDHRQCADGQAGKSGDPPLCPLLRLGQCSLSHGSDHLLFSASTSYPFIILKLSDLRNQYSVNKTTPPGGRSRCVICSGAADPA